MWKYYELGDEPNVVEKRMQFYIQLRYLYRWIRPKFKNVAFNSTKMHNFAWKIHYFWIKMQQKIRNCTLWCIMLQKSSKNTCHPYNSLFCGRHNVGRTHSRFLHFYQAPRHKTGTDRKLVKFCIHVCCSYNKCSRIAFKMLRINGSVPAPCAYKNTHFNFLYKNTNLVPF